MPVSVRLDEVTPQNWRSVVAVSPRSEQAEFVTTVARYLCLCHYGGEWHPLAISTEDEVVGHVMWAEDAEDASIWIGGLVIDAEHQGGGIGRATMLALIDRFQGAPGGMALSYSPDNTVARNLYASVGFGETGETVDEEIVARRR
jgi:diamine N-acetyltransferase